MEGSVELVAMRQKLRKQFFKVLLPVRAALLYLKQNAPGFFEDREIREKISKLLDTKKLEEAQQLFNALCEDLSVEHSEISSQFGDIYALWTILKNIKAAPKIFFMAAKQDFLGQRVVEVVTSSVHHNAIKALAEEIKNIDEGAPTAAKIELIRGVEGKIKIEAAHATAMEQHLEQMRQTYFLNNQDTFQKPLRDLRYNMRCLTDKICSLANAHPERASFYQVLLNHFLERKSNDSSFIQVSRPGFLGYWLGQGVPVVRNDKTLAQKEVSKRFEHVVRLYSLYLQYLQQKIDALYMQLIRQHTQLHRSLNATMIISHELMQSNDNDMAQRESVSLSSDGRELQEYSSFAPK